MIHVGAIVNEAAARRLVLFDGLEAGRATPTDIDCFCELFGEGYWFLEIKSKTPLAPAGQKIALERMAFDLARSGKLVVLVFAVSHENGDIRAADAEIFDLIINGKRVSFPRGMTVAQLWREFVRECEARRAAHNSSARNG